MEPNNLENQSQMAKPTENQKLIPAAILIAGLIIAGAVLLKGGTPPVKTATPKPDTIELRAVSAQDRILGNKDAKVIIVMYEDFKCSWCVKFNNESERSIKDTYIKTGEVALVYRDFPFLSDESFRAAEAGYCAHDQGKFWEFHDAVFTNQGGPNKTTLEDQNLKSFAKAAGLNSAEFDQCLDSGKHTQAVLEAKDAGELAGVRGTPKGFILKGGEIVDTIDGYLSVEATNQKIEAALK